MHDATTQEAGPRAGRREWLGFAVLALPTMLLAMDQSILYLALPHLSASLGAGATESLWILDIYGFMLAGFLVTMGTLSDRLGRRRVLLAGAAVFTVATVVAAFAPTPLTLILARAAMGVAGATLMPSTLALLSTMFRDPVQRGTAIAMWFSCLMLGGALGPVVGGALLQFFWWGSTFLVGVPVMVVLLVAGPALLPEYRAPGAGRIDVASVALSLAAVLPVIYGIKELAAGADPALALAAVALGVALGIAFVLRQRRLEHPLVDVRLFGDRTFASALVILLFGSVTTGGMYLFVSQYLQSVQQLDPLQAGLWLVPSTLAIVAGSMVAPVLAQRVRPGLLIAGGLVLTALGYLLLTLVDSTTGLPLLIGGFVLAFLGGGPMGALGTNMVMSAAPPEKAGSAASMSETGNQLGIALGIAVMGSIGTAVYRGRLAEGAPEGVPAAAFDSISSAEAAAADLPPAVAQELLAVAREAFSTGLNAVALVGAVLFAGLAALTVATLRDVLPVGGPPAGGPQGDAAPGGGTDSPLQEDVRS